MAVREGQPVWQCLHEDCLCWKTLSGATVCVGDIVTPAHPHHGRYKLWSIGEDRFATLQGVVSRGEEDSLTDFWITVLADDLFPATTSTTA